jgi:hypothetical protein
MELLPKGLITFSSLLYGAICNRFIYVFVSLGDFLAMNNSDILRQTARLLSQFKDSSIRR